MDISRKNLGIFYINIKGLAYYSNSSLAVQVELPPGIIHDMEILNEGKLKEFVNFFIQSNKIPPANVIILLASDFIFKKEFIAVPDPDNPIEEEVEKFLETVPFEKVSNKILKSDKKWKVFAVSTDLCEQVQKSAEINNFQVMGIVPVPILKEIFPEMSQDLNLQLIFEKFDTVKQYSILDLNSGNKSKKLPLKSKNTNHNLNILLAIFFISLFFLIILIYFNIFLPENSKIVSP